MSGEPFAADRTVSGESYAVNRTVSGEPLAADPAVTGQPFNPFSLAGRTVLVTGASSGIGRQTAISCAAMGARLVVTGRDPARLGETCAALQGEGHRSIAADMAEPDGLARVAEEAGVIDGLVNCAGITAMAPFRMTSEKHIRRIHGINFDAPILLTQKLLAAKRIANGASLVYVTSTTAHIGTFATGIYAASKGALIPALRALALEVGAKQKIRANCISPGYVQTPMLDALNAGTASIEANYDLAPLGLGQPEDVANAAVFLLSDASRWITRSTLMVDGGLTVHVSI